MGIEAIVSGHVNEMLGLNQDISSNRLRICHKCPLLKNTILGPICNSDLWIDVKTGDISATKKSGYKNGCGCRLKAKSTLPNASCPIGKW